MQVKKTLEAAGLHKYFKVMLGPEDYKTSKPSPGGFLRAAELLGVDPKFCVGFEDAEFGFQAIQNANYLMGIDVKLMQSYEQT